MVEVTKWGLGDTTVDPGETLLRLLSQSAARVERYSLLVAQAYDAAERLQWASIDAAKELDGGDTSAREKARQDMDRVFNDGAVAALIGNTYSSSESGVFASGEAIRALVELENQERDRCARFAKLALDAGIAERQVRIAEQLGQHVVAVLRLTLVKLGLEVTEAAVHAAVAESMKELVA